MFAIHAKATRTQIRTLREKKGLPAAPLIIATERSLDPELERRLAPRDVLSFEEIQPCLLIAIHHEILCDEYERLRAEARKALIEPSLAKAIVAALKAAATTRAIRRPNELSASVGRSLRSLDEAFRRATGGDFTLTEFLSGLQLICALEHRWAGKTWLVSAGEVDFTKRSLRRKSQTWLGCGLTGLESWDPPALLARFERDYLRPLLRSG